jgi:polyhydroxyalkanoate synthesis regulator phasin
MSARRIAAIALAGGLLAGGTGVAIAAVSKDDGTKTEQAILDNAAKRLNVTPEKLRDALSAAQDAQLDQMVKDGTLTQKQADAIKARRKQSGRVLGGPFGGGPPGFRTGGGPGFGLHHGPRGGVFLDLAKALGITRAQLETQLRAGKSPADIAKAQGKSLDDVRAALKADAKTRIDEAVKDGDLTQAQADKILAHLDEGLAHLGDAPPRMFEHGHRGMPDMRPGGFAPGAPDAPAPVTAAPGGAVS